MKILRCLSVTLVRRASAGQTLRIKGTCYESVKVAKRLTLVGIDGAIVDSGHAGRQIDGVIKVVGAKRVKIRDLTVRKAPNRRFYTIGRRLTRTVMPY